MAAEAPLFEEPPTPDAEELMRDIDSYDEATLDKVLRKMTQQQQQQQLSSSSSPATTAPSTSACHIDLTQQQYHHHNGAAPPAATSGETSWSVGAFWQPDPGSGPSGIGRAPILVASPSPPPPSPTLPDVGEANAVAASAPTQRLEQFESEEPPHSFLTQELQLIFPDASVECLEAEVDKRLAAEESLGADTREVLQALVTHLLEVGYQRKKKKWRLQADAEAATASVNVDGGTPFDWRQQCVLGTQRRMVQDVLAQEFRSVSIRSVAEVTKAFKYSIAAAYRFLYKVVRLSKSIDSSNNSNNNKNSIAWQSLPEHELTDATFKNLPFDLPHSLTLIGRPRGAFYLARRSSDSNQMSQEIIEQLQFAKEQMANWTAALSSAQQQQQEQQELQESESAEYECECCYGTFQFNNMCQCPIGHLFCRTCLAAYIREKVHGTGQLSVECMAPDCGHLYQRSQLQLAVDAEILKKLDERLAEENLRSAQFGERLQRCSACGWAAEFDDDNATKVFRCGNCEKEVCRLCGVDWEEHFGLRCAEIERDEEARLRTEFEEKMTQARVRVCYQCFASVMKTGGCNHITCRCGAHFCYICRVALQASNPYSHFCSHTNSGNCNCGKCSVQSTNEQDEQRAIDELRQQAKETQRQRGFEERPVGPDAKRSRQQ